MQEDARGTWRDLTRWVGSEVRGFDVRTSTDLEVAALRCRLADRGVLVLRDQSWSAADISSFADKLGPVLRHPYAASVDHPDLFRLRNDERSLYADGDSWHADFTWMTAPPLYSILALDVLPSVGGDTLFASAARAAAVMSRPLRHMLGGLRGVHQRRDSDHATEHPLLVRHPVSGQEVLYTNASYTARVTGLPSRESNWLVALLNEHVANDVDLQCRISWQPGTILVWDNQAVQHRACWDYHPATRAGWRATCCPSVPSPAGERDDGAQA